ncbi:MAG: Aspartate-semialdehyde dehydrogenase [Candidatus Anoxychlamydiales bacterium]|nr:Aspartate-semialdehyde dehydrogenase [Candidatus Anoxychlamydiales bacterium]
MSYNIAIVGSTGIVGKELLKLLETSNIKIKNLKLFASQKSVGKKLVFRKNNHIIQSLNLQSLKNLDFIFFAAGSKISKKYIPKLKNSKTYVIDLSSAFRNKKDIPLIIPEINSKILDLKTTDLKKSNIIASPNCTTTIMLMALHNLHKTFKIKRIVAATYQAASGGGKKLMDQLINDTKNHLNPEKISEDNLYGFNLFLHESESNEKKYSQEEMKMILETQKILDDKNIKITSTCVRVPVLRAHSIALNVEFEKKFSITEIYEILEKTKNVKIFEDFKKNKFITPQMASFQKEVFVSRIRQDISNPKAIDLWVCADQLLKGASLNAFQILQSLLKIK